MAARNTRKKRVKPKKIPVALIFVSGILLAVLAWFFWSELERLAKPAQKKVAAKLTRESPPEELSEQERTNLDKLLKPR